MAGIDAGTDSCSLRSRRIILIALAITAIVVGSAVFIWWQTDENPDTTSGTPLTALTRDASSLRFVISEDPHFSYLNESTAVDTQWGDVRILFMNASDEATSLIFRTSTDNLTGYEGQSVTIELSPMGVVATPFWVNCTITDLAGNGLVNEGDSFTLVPDGFTLEPGSVHTVAMDYCATGQAMAEYELTA